MLSESGQFCVIVSGPNLAGGAITKPIAVNVDYDAIEELDPINCAAVNVDVTDNVMAALARMRGAT